MSEVCNLLVLITYVYHNARFKKRKVYGFLLLFLWMYFNPVDAISVSI